MDREAVELEPTAPRAYTGALVPATPADAIDGVMPRQVAMPSSNDEVAQLIACAVRDRTAIVCTGAGTLAGVGNAPRAFDLALRTSGLARVVEHNPDDMTICVQAGMACGALDELLARSNQRVAIDVADPSSTIGGILATNETGGLE